MKHILFAMSLLILSACGGGSEGSGSDDSDSLDDTGLFTLQNIRFDAKDFYDGELVAITTGTRFELQWVSPTSSPYRIDLYLTANGASHSDNNKVVGLKCGNESFSLCPNATGEMECEIGDNTLSCFIGNDSVGSRSYKDEHLPSLAFIIRGCDALGNCDIKTFQLSVEKA